MLKVTLLVITMAVFSLNATWAQDPLDLDLFELPAPAQSDLGQSYKLWATYYYLPEINEDSGSIPLRDSKGQELGPTLTLKHWCDTAMEGSVKINFKNGDLKTFNYHTTTDDHFVDCSSVYSKFPKLGKTKFREAHGVYGDGLDDYVLSPYRTLATDVSVIKPGTAIYIPQARGAKITLKSGRVITHDGYFFAADKGGAIKGTHVDVYIGVSKDAPFFPWIGSNEAKKFDAFVVKDAKIIQELLALHTVQ
jgi:3D (Asp-Asp-Asp) domain-containing protein